MQEYVNGCYTKCGLRPINCMEIKHQEDLGQGFFFRCGVLPKPDDVSVDILKDGEVVAWEHGITLLNITRKLTMERTSQLRSKQTKHFKGYIRKNFGWFLFDKEITKIKHLLWFRALKERVILHIKPEYRQNLIFD